TCSPGPARPDPPLPQGERWGGGARASGSGSVVLPAGMINPSVPIRNIRMKFAVLIGLIQVGEVSNRDIVETVLNLVSGRAPRPGDAPAGTGPRSPPPPGAAPAPLCNPTGTCILPPPVSILHVLPFSNHPSFPNSSCASPR
uniref:Neurobeachin n=1 Tax=Malurus cyaneus samueli TaxID=2593467 RepID=A0A8C5TBS7_9PASS